MHIHAHTYTHTHKHMCIHIHIMCVYTSINLIIFEVTQIEEGYLKRS